MPTDQDGIERFWRHLLAGVASIRFHRSPSGLGLNQKAVACIRAARQLESKISLWSVQPANHLVRDRTPKQAYLAAEPGRRYALYLPAGDGVGLDLSACRSPVAVHGIDIERGVWGPKQEVSVSARVLLTAPGPGNWAAAILPRTE